MLVKTSSVRLLSQKLTVFESFYMHNSCQTLPIVRQFTSSTVCLLNRKQILEKREARKKKEKLEKIRKATEPTDPTLKLLHQHGIHIPKGVTLNSGDESTSNDDQISDEHEQNSPEVDTTEYEKEGMFIANEFRDITQNMTEGELISYFKTRWSKAEEEGDNPNNSASTASKGYVSYAERDQPKTYTYKSRYTSEDIQQDEKDFSQPQIHTIASTSTNTSIERTYDSDIYEEIEEVVEDEVEESLIDTNKDNILISDEIFDEISHVDINENGDLVFRHPVTSNMHTTTGGVQSDGNTVQHHQHQQQSIDNTVENLIEEGSEVDTIVSYSGSYNSDGAYHGYGVLTFVNGACYKGDFVNGLYCGKGIYTYANGDILECEFSNDAANGFGKLKCSDGSIFEGHFVDNAYEGYGILHYNNGISYRGNWVKGQMHGSGALFCPAENDFVIQQGSWNMGEFEGSIQELTTGKS